MGFTPSLQTLPQRPLPSPTGTASQNQTALRDPFRAPGHCPPWAASSSRAGVILGGRLETHKENQLNSGGARSSVCTWELVLSPLGMKKIMKAKSSPRRSLGCPRFTRQHQQRLGAAGRAASTKSHRARLCPGRPPQLPEPVPKARLALSPRAALQSPCVVWLWVTLSFLLFPLGHFMTGRTSF